MISPVRLLALAPTETGRRGSLGLCLSVLCLLHCVGAAALVPLLPIAFAFLTENVAVEWFLLVVSATLAARSCWVGRLPRHLGTPVWAAATGAGVAGLLSEQESLLRVSLASLAVLQLWRVLAGSRRCAG
jgi:hypothetical protein